MLAVVGSRAEAVLARDGAGVPTPHPGEMAKRLDEDPERVFREAASVAREAARFQMVGSAGGGTADIDGTRTLPRSASL